MTIFLALQRYKFSSHTARMSGPNTYDSGALYISRIICDICHMKLSSLNVTYHLQLWQISHSQHTYTHLREQRRISRVKTYDIEAGYKRVHHTPPEMSRLLAALVFSLLAAATTDALGMQHKVIGNECGHAFIPAMYGICPGWVLERFGGLAPGTCQDAGFSVFAYTRDVFMGPCGSMKVAVFRRPETRRACAAAPRACTLHHFAWVLPGSRGVGRGVRRRCAGEGLLHAYCE